MRFAMRYINCLWSQSIIPLGGCDSYDFITVYRHQAILLLFLQYEKINGHAYERYNIYHCIYKNPIQTTKFFGRKFILKLYIKYKSPKQIETKWRIYVSVNETVIGSNHGLMLSRHQTINWNIAGLLLIGSNQLEFKHLNSFKKI